MYEEYEIGHQIIHDCYFLKRGDFPKELLREIIDRIENFNKCSEYKILVTYNRFSSLDKQICKLINEAKSTIMLVAYELDHKKIIDILAKKANELMGGVYLITNLEKEIEDYFLEEEESPRKEYLEEIRTELAKSGVYLRGINAHAKFLIVDKKHLLLMSANITRKALGDVDEGKLGNFEIGILISDENIVKRALYFFQYLWFSSTWEILPDDKNPVVTVVDQRVQRKKLKKMREKLHHWYEEDSKEFWENQNGSKRKAFFVYTCRGYDYNFLLIELLKLINKAREEIIIASYNFVKVPNEISNALKDAVKRGVKVKILVRPMNFRKDQRRSLYDFLKDKELQNSVVFGGLPINHAKLVIVDRKYVLISSMNLDGRHKEKGFEAGIILHDPELARLLSDILEWLLKESSHRIKMNPYLWELVTKTDNKPIIIEENLIILVKASKKSRSKFMSDLRCNLVEIWYDESSKKYFLVVITKGFEKCYEIIESSPKLDMVLGKKQKTLSLLVQQKAKYKTAKFVGYLMAKNLIVRSLKFGRERRKGKKKTEARSR